MRQAIASRHVVTPKGVRAATVVYEDGRITAVEESAPSPSTLDVGELWLLPGLVDSHVHINDPGRAHWEGFSHATRAAAAGGFTCLIDMPLNSIPATTSVEALAAKREAARSTALVDYGFWGGVIEGNHGHIASLAAAGVRGFKSFLIHPGIDEFTMVAERDLHLALPFVAQANLPLLVHAELPEPIADAQKYLLAQSISWPDYPTYLASRPAAAETLAIELMIRLCRQYGCRVHIVHLSAADALPVLRSARAEGLPITVETCPHYLYFAAEDIPPGATHYKCAPPIRESSNRALLWEALRDGTIDLVATDHSPCSPDLRNAANGDFRSAWGGIASLSVAFAATWTAARSRKFAVPDLVRWMSQRPAELAGIQSAKGALAPGYDADFCIFDPDTAFTATPDDLHFRHAFSPYVGERLYGRVRSTYVRGKRVFHEHEFASGPAGRECTPRPSPEPLP